MRYRVKALLVRISDWLWEQGRRVNNGESWLSTRRYPHSDNDVWTVRFWRLSRVVNRWAGD